MSSPDSSNTSEDKCINVKDVGGNFVYTPIRDHNITNILVGKNINTNNLLVSVSKHIGKGFGYVSDLIKKEIIELIVVVNK